MIVSAGRNIIQPKLSRLDSDISLAVSTFVKLLGVPKFGGALVPKMLFIETLMKCHSLLSNYEIFF